ncbi:retrotransposon ORF1 [Tanacetum coccineum]
MRARGNYGGSAQVVGDNLLIKFVRKSLRIRRETDHLRPIYHISPLFFVIGAGQAIEAAVTSGNKRFFLGTNHDRLKKECACECVGVFNALYALSVYAKANIISGGNVGEPVIYIALQLKIMDKLPFDNKLPFKLGMTINKSQGQTLPKVGLILQRPVFSHGQLYVNQEGFEGTHDGEARSSRSKRPRQHETMEELLLPQVHHEFLLWEHIYLPCIVNWDVLNQMGCDGEIDDMLRIRFDEVCADDELQSKKIIKFRLGGRAHSLTLLEFARRLGLYQAIELEEDGFNVYFEGGLRNDDNFNAQDYWLSISREENLRTHNGETGSSRSKRSRNETVEELLLSQVHHEFLLWEGCTRDAKSRYNTRLAQLLPRHIYSPCIVNWDVLNRMGCGGEINNMLRIRVQEAESKEEIFTSVFHEVCADDELQSKKIIKFRLGGRAHSLTLLEFAHRLGLYQVVELGKDGFNVYFEGGTDNAKITRKRSKPDKHRHGNEKCVKEPEFISKLARKCMVLTKDVVRSLSAPIYYRDLDTTTLRDLIDSNVFEHMAGVYSVPLQGAYNPPGYAQPQYQPQQLQDDDE